MHRPAAGLGQGRQRERFSTVEIQKIAGAVRKRRVLGRPGRGGRHAGNPGQLRGGACPGRRLLRPCGGGRRRKLTPGLIPTRTQAVARPKARRLFFCRQAIRFRGIPPGRLSGAADRFESRQSDLSFPGIQAAFRPAEAEGTGAASGLGVPPRLHPALVPPAIRSAFPSGSNRDRLAPSKRLPPNPANAPSLRPASQGGVRTRRTSRRGRQIARH